MTKNTTGLVNRIELTKPNATQACLQPLLF